MHSARGLVIRAMGLAGVLGGVLAGFAANAVPAFAAANVLEVRDFGARCDGSTDDAAALNAAFDALRDRLAATAAAQPRVLSPPMRIEFPTGVCVVRSTLNWTGLNSAALEIDGAGATVYGRIRDRPVIDALGSKFIVLSGLTIQGDSEMVPSVGLQIGRIDSTARDGGGSGIHVANVRIFGHFSLAGLYNLNGEVDEFDHIWINNFTASRSAYALIEDGINHFGLKSAFVTEAQPADSPESFEQNLFLQASINCVACAAPIWVANATNHRYINSYIANTYKDGGAAVILYGSPGTGITMLDMDLHVESGSGRLDDIFLVSGPDPTPAFIGMTYRENGSDAVRSVFKLDTGVASAALRDARLEIASFPVRSAVVFNEPDKWTFSGSATVPAGPHWNLPIAAASGSVSLGGVVGGRAQAFGSGLVLQDGVLSVSLPTPLNIAAIAARGSVAAFTVPTGTFNIQSGHFPTIAIAAPPDGGTQATASVRQMSCVTPGFMADGGHGYHVGDVLTVVGGTLAGPHPCAFSVGSVGAGGSLSTGFVAGGNLHPNAYTTLPAGPIALAGGHGTGATLAGINWHRMVVAPTAAGSGYITPPAVAAAPYDAALGDSLTTPVVIVAELTGTFSAEAGKGAVTLGNAGTVLGTSGMAGAPVIAKGAMVDGSGIRLPLTAAGAVVPSNTSLVRLTQAGPLMSATLALPDAVPDGQPIQFINYGGAIARLSFAPAVNGWTNGATLQASSGLRIRWDSTAAAWYREQ